MTTQGNTRAVAWTDPAGVLWILAFRVDENGGVLGTAYKNGAGWVAHDVPLSDSHVPQVNGKAPLIDCFEPAAQISVLVGALNNPHLIHITGRGKDGKTCEVGSDGGSWFRTL